MTPPSSRIKPRHYALALALFAAAAAILLAMGRTPICTCGVIRLWQGEVISPENSQQLTDWYSFSHIVHGLLFYWAFAALFPRLAFGLRFVAAVGIEAAWEVFENTDFVINRYREATIALDYFGDSVLNSLSDIAMMAIGFAFAALMPAGASVALGLGLELFAGAMIRDNLTLNVIMLLYPIEAIRTWQTG